MAHSPEGRRIFPRLTVEENLLLGAFSRNDGGIKNDLEAAYDLFPILRERAKQPAGTFSGGEQQMLAMGRAMMSRPKLLMLDEPSMGLSPLMMQRIMTTVTTLQQQGTTIPARRAERSRRLWAGRTRAMSSRSARSCCPGRARSCSTTTRSAGYLGED